MNKEIKNNVTLRSDRYNFDDQKFCFIDEFSKEIFIHYFTSDEEWDKFFINIQKNNKALFRQITYFYYWRTWLPLQNLKDEDNNNPLPDLIIIIIFSIMEKLVQKLNRRFENKQAVKYFYERYFTQKDKETINKNFICVLQNGKKTKNSEDFISILYEYRNGYVHQAEFMGLLINNDINFSDHPKEQKTYKIDFSIRDFCKMLEKAVINYFENSKN